MSPPLLPPAIIGASGIDGAVRLTWSSNVSQHRIHYATQSFGSVPVVNYGPLLGYDSVDVASGTSHKVTGLTNGTTYYFVVTAVQDGKDSDASNEVSATPQVLQASRLNDTGITWGGDYAQGKNSTCISNITAPQDCDQGRDAQAAAKTLQKEGDGHAGFDFTKLDAKGNALTQHNEAWSEIGKEAEGTRWFCVRDNVTGLVWEVKTTAASPDSRQDIKANKHNNIHHKDNLYRWGGLTAIGRNHTANTTKKELYYKDWNGLVEGSNREQLCGHSDWRVPKLQELLSIVEYSRVNPAIDVDYFPNTPHHSFWLSSPYANPYANSSGSAWGVGFGYGYDYDDNRYFTNRLRLVRVGQQLFGFYRVIAKSAATRLSHKNLH